MRKSVALIIAITFTAGSAQAAGYLKFGDIKGESTDAADDKHKDWIDVLSIDWGSHQPGSGAAAGRQSAQLTIKENKQAVLVGLLLPAVQSARAATSARSTTGRVAERLRHKDRMTYHETARGRVAKSWTLHDVEYRRLRATGRVGATHTLNITYKCKDWKNLATGKAGSDCNQPARGKKGNVETEFKVEKGE